jgi:hypothetical protein
MLLIVLLYRKQILPTLAGFGALFKIDVLSWGWTLGISLGIVILAVLVALAQDFALLFGLAALLAALVLEFIEKRQLKSA